MINAKKKGNSFEYDVRDSLKHLDPTIRRSLGSGSFKQFLGSDNADIVSSLPFDIECKFHKSMAIYTLWQQAQDQCTKIDRIPILAVKANREIPLAVMKWSDFIQLLEFALKAGYAPQQFAKPRRKPKKTTEDTSNLLFSKEKQIRKKQRE